MKYYQIARALFVRKPPIQGHIPSGHTSPIVGEVVFKYDHYTKVTLIEANLTGLPKLSQLAWHIHDKGVLTSPPTCDQLGGHFNPDGHQHGGPPTSCYNHSGHGHAGDLGNLVTDSNGNSSNWLSIGGSDAGGHLAIGDGSVRDIVGKYLVIHQRVDDLGRLPTVDSRATGSSGPRMVCAQIKYVDHY